MRRLALLLLGACASGGQPDVPDALRVDGMHVDMVLIDAPPTQTLSQTASNALEAGTSQACLAASSGTAPNNYYRVFDLAAFDIATDFHVSQVTFQVEHCDQLSGTAGATVVVRVGTYSGTPGDTLTLANMTVLASVNNVMVPEVIEDPGPPPVTAGATVTAPISATIPAGQKLFVEIDAPDGNALYEMYMGANNDGEMGFGYVLAPTCGISVPTNISSIVGEPLHLLITVTGSY
jgi:hypothetical protein